jgi:hypothetical protein
MNFFQRFLKNKKISRSLREYHKVHRNLRAIPVKSMGKVVAYAHVPKQSGFKPAVHI